MFKTKKIIDAIRDKGKNLEAEMSFFDHIEELRWHLIRSGIAITVCMILCFVFWNFYFNTVIMGPYKPNFWTYRMLCKIGLGCITKINAEIINTEMAGQFTLQINAGLIGGLVLGFPYLLWELWRFIKPALHEKERRSAQGFVMYAWLLFLLGVLFGYYIIAPESISFLAGYTISDSIVNKFTIDSYLSSVATLTLATGAVFELPILVYILANLGILTAKIMRKGRRYAIVIIMIVAAVITPTPDMLTMTIVSVPLYVLFEVGILVAALVERRKLKRSGELTVID